MTQSITLQLQTITTIPATRTLYRYPDTSSPSVNTPLCIKDPRFGMTHPALRSFKINTRNISCPYISHLTSIILAYPSFPCRLYIQFMLCTSMCCIFFLLFFKIYSKCLLIYNMCLMYIYLHFCFHHPLIYSFFSSPIGSSLIYVYMYILGGCKCGYMGISMH